LGIILKLKLKIYIEVEVEFDLSGTVAFLFILLEAPFRECRLDVAKS
jgi:hypothetical protein